MMQRRRRSNIRERESEIQHDNATSPSEQTINSPEGAQGHEPSIETDETITCTTEEKPKKKTNKTGEALELSQILSTESYYQLCLTHCDMMVPILLNKNYIKCLLDLKSIVPDRLYPLACNQLRHAFNELHSRMNRFRVGTYTPSPKGACHRFVDTNMSMLRFSTVIVHSYIHSSHLNQLQFITQTLLSAR